MMTKKNILNYCGLWALVIAIVLAACSTDPKPENTGTLSLSGQVNKREINIPAVSYNEISGNMKVSDDGMGGKGSIKNGKLSYSIKKPTGENYSSAADQISALTQLSGGALTQLLPDVDLSDISGIYADANVSPADTQAAFLNLEITDNDYFGFIDRELIEFKYSISPMGFTITIEGVNYVYVDKDSTITATGTDITVPIDISFLSETAGTIPIKLALSNINLNLKKGWNALGIKVTVTVGLTGGQGKINFSCKTPAKVSSSLKWVANPPIE